MHFSVLPVCVRAGEADVLCVVSVCACETPAVCEPVSTDSSQRSAAGDIIAAFLAKRQELNGERISTLPTPPYKNLISLSRMMCRLCV